MSKFREIVNPSAAYSPVGPFKGSPDTAGSTATAIDLSAWVGSFVQIQVDPEATGYALISMCSANNVTPSATDGTAPADDKGVAKLGAGGSAEWQITSAAPFLTFIRSASTDVKLFYWIS